ncbi:hypothetical protein DL96DRAFT_456775 [Flagelloscypha sp. PMI_526]|nr:hypothetical protein DL96DRAFT_456775 [Flagelloscypha sp. PMI_526]
MSNVHKTTTSILAKVDSINFITMSPVFLDSLAVNFTEEGLERIMTLWIYSRWKLVCELMPALEKAVSLGQPATVYNVLVGAEISGPVDFENLGFGKKPTGMEERRTSAPSYTNMIMKHLAKEHPQISWVHAMPGFVNTGIFDNVKDSWLFWIFSSIVAFLGKFFGNSPEDSGEYMTYAMLQATPKETGLQFVTQNGDEAKVQPKFDFTRAEGEKVWEHFVEAALHKLFVIVPPLNACPTAAILRLYLLVLVSTR